MFRGQDILLLRPKGGWATFIEATDNPRLLK
jgi:hypothetical protein